QIGLYNLAYTLGMVVHLFGLGIISAYGPVYYERATDCGFRPQLGRILAGCILVYSWVTLAISLMAPEIFRLMTRPAYYGAAALVPWIAVGYWCFVAVYQPCLSVIEYHRRTEWTMFLTGPAALVNMALNWVLIPRYGILAASGTTLMAFFLMAGSALVVSRRL